MVNEKCQCAVCGELYNRSYEKRHFASKKHLKASGGSNLGVNAMEVTLAESKKQDDIESDDDTDISVTATANETDDDSFLEDLGADKWVSPEDVEHQQKEQKKRDAEMAKMRREEARDLALQEKHEKARQKFRV